MSPPEVWGPPIWTFFHVLAEKVNENAFPIIKNQLFLVIKRICGFLPCPECSRDANIFLEKVKINEFKNKNDFKNMLFFFHNHVNLKKKKHVYSYQNLEVYKRYNIINVFNNFIRVYHTKGNMKQLSESFQRQFVITDVRKWLTQNIRAFITMMPNQPSVNESQNVNEEEPIIIQNEEEPIIIQNEEEPIIIQKEEEPFVIQEEEELIIIQNKEKEPIVIQKEEEPFVIQEEEEPFVIQEEEEPLVIQEEEEPLVIQKEEEPINKSSDNIIAKKKSNKRKKK